ANPNASNNTTSATTNVGAQSLHDAPPIGPARITAGQNAVYIVSVTNNGASPAAAVIVSDPTPANLTFVSNSGACTTPYPCNLGTLNSGQTATHTTTYRTSPAFIGSVTKTP